MTIQANIRFRKHYEEMRDLWQARCLEYATGKMARVFQSVLAHSFAPDAVATLFKVVYPKYSFAPFPMYVSAGRILSNGAITARRAKRQEELFDLDTCEWSIVFTSETEMTKAFRDMADAVKLTDKQRRELFDAAKAWIVCDYRQPVSGPQLEEFIAERNGQT
jgi:hypothetical protein